MRNHLGFAIKGLLLLLFVVSAAYLPNAIMLYSGYCPKEKRYLTSQEKLEIAVADTVNRRVQLSFEDYTMNEAGEKIHSRKLIPQYRYSSLNEFYELNPNCCFFIENFQREARKFYTPCGKKLTGELNVLIYISYIFAFRESDNSPIYSGRELGLSNCGKLLTNLDVIMLNDPNW